MNASPAHQLRRLAAFAVFSTCAWVAHAAELPKILFLANPMTSDNDVIRRPASGELSVAEKHFAALSRGVFNVTITQDGAEVAKEKLSR